VCPFLECMQLDAVVSGAMKLSSIEGSRSFAFVRHKLVVLSDVAPRLFSLKKAFLQMKFKPGAIPCLCSITTSIATGDAASRTVEGATQMFVSVGSVSPSRHIKRHEHVVDVARC
jgi:hypothetical protein